MSPLRSRLEAVGAPGRLLDLWFAATLREGFGLTLSGAFESFAVVGQAMLAGMLGELGGVRTSADEAAQEVLAGIGELPLHGDVAPALRTLASGGMRIVALTN